MKTENSIDLKQAKEACSSRSELIVCDALVHYLSDCGTYKCPFYKPEGCKDWIRVEDEEGISLVPPEEYYKTVKKRAEKPGVWKVRWERT